MKYRNSLRNFSTAASDSFVGKIYFVSLFGS